jgi:CHASE1-domain containing sensor protein
MPLLRRTSVLLPLSARVVLLSVLMSGLCATGALFFLVSRLETRQEELRFRELAQRRFTAIRIGTDGALTALQGVNQLFAAMGAVSSEQFRIYTRPLLQAHPYLLALGFQRIVLAQERAAYEAMMRSTFAAFQITELAPDGSLTCAGNRAAYRVVEYVEPAAGNEVVFGMDSGFMEVQNVAMRRAAQLGLPAATALFGLAQYKGMKKGFLVLLPVHAGKSSEKGGAPTRLVGYNAALFRADELFARILASTNVASTMGLTISVHALASGQVTEEVFRTASPASAVSWLESHVARLCGSRPLPLHEDILGLDAAIEWLVGQFQRRSGIHCRLAWNSGAAILDERVATALFRIVQEALANVLRHADASEVTITLGSNAGTVNMTITDDGRGAQPEDCCRAGGFGLAGIRERVVALGGKFDIVGAPGIGLTLIICLPG